MFSIHANTTYAIEDGKHSIEISYNDSDGTNVGAYAEGDTFEGVIADAIDQLDEAIAEFDDDRADVEESAKLEAQIAELQAKIDQLSAENEKLKARHEEKMVSNDPTPKFTYTLNDLLKKIDKKDAEWENLFSQWGL